MGFHYLGCDLFVLIMSFYHLGCFQVPSFHLKDVSGRTVSVRAQVTTEAPAKVEKVHKKMEEGVIVNKFKPKEPYIGRCLLNTKITGDDAPGETWHMVFSTEGIITNLSFGVYVICRKLI